MYHKDNVNFVNGITLNVRDKNELKPFYVGRIRIKYYK